MSDIQTTLDERGKRYGDFAEHARISQALKRVMHDTPNWNKLPDDHKEALEMIQHKIARWLNGDCMYDDNPRDIAGYATLVENALNSDE